MGGASGPDAGSGVRLGLRALRVLSGRPDPVIRRIYRIEGNAAQIEAIGRILGFVSTPPAEGYCHKEWFVRVDRAEGPMARVIRLGVERQARLDDPKETRTYQVTGRPDEFSVFERILGTINALCAYGASRRITFSVDGDGAARLHCARLDDGEELELEAGDDIEEQIDYGKDISCGGIGS